MEKNKIEFVETFVNQFSDLFVESFMIRYIAIYGSEKLDFYSNMAFDKLIEKIKFKLIDKNE